MTDNKPHLVHRPGDKLRGIRHIYKYNLFKGEGTGLFVAADAVDPAMHTRSHAGPAYLLKAVQQRANARRDRDTCELVFAPRKKLSCCRRSPDTTPQLLELSEMENISLLRALDIAPVIDNPGVDENLQDHGIVSFGYKVAESVSCQTARDPQVAAAAMAAYHQDGSGPLGMIPHVSVNMPILDEPGPGLGSKQAHALQQLLGFSASLTTLCYALSRGSVHIRSSKPQNQPALDHGILRQPVDVELHARHAMWMEKLVATPSMAAVLKGVRIRSPQSLTDPEQAKGLTKELLLSTFHLAGTCAMMSREDGGVADPHLVYGTRNVRVVDASDFSSFGASRSIQATGLVVAEKAMNIIKENLHVATISDGLLIFCVELLHNSRN
ncbi:FAD-linked reductase, C-terminal domain-containing protein [Aspergillus homomorphus CBS 101889]|uniref:FAD-linked reductase, C-terminal domain-containing protein n=1 Tax=Aspergillus homomorphus (strain CBS 101889) TaxID=1450537 RepID=A0A395HWD4_ASPHC|nr:FAD-linked reductase, C-terminal domain-containing protein [Aspergillus homomorphus CBS 101889]RAL11733.1 FAD-linked reductase, C-terminal domain-containing protein [Aspergillus homomorphus CBS 101889]